jgi:hypothetical protein
MMREATMRTRHGFARLLPLIVLTGLAAGTLALLACERRVQAPTRDYGPGMIIVTRNADECSGPCDPSEIKGGFFFDVKIPGAHLSGRVLTECTFDRTNLRGATFRGVTFRRCKFIDCDLAGADLTGATYDRFTQWPPGFDPQAHGARLVE